MKYFRKLVGKKCYLSPVNLDDVEKYTEWINDIDTSLNVCFLHQVINVNKERSMLQSLTQNNKIFGIVEKKTDKLIGNCGLHDISYIDRKCEFGIFIGEKDRRNEGFGTEATKLILDFAFNALNLHSVMLRVFSFNKRAIHIYEKCGFKIIGKRREARIIGSSKYDVLFMDILVSEYESIYIESKKEDVAACLER